MREEWRSQGNKKKGKKKKKRTCPGVFVMGPFGSLARESPIVWAPLRATMSRVEYPFEEKRSMSPCAVRSFEAVK